MDRPQVPKFGNWESGDSVPYTLHFETVRQRKGRKKVINVSDPRENPQPFADMAPQAEAEPPPRKLIAEPEELTVRESMRPNHERRMQSSESPARTENVGWRSAHGVGGRPNSGRPARQSTGFEHCFERSPLHPHFQAKVAANRRSSYDSHATPERSRMRSPNRGHYSPESDAAVPKFGEWDESNASSADDYSHIFEKVREKRHNDSAKSPNRVREPSFAPKQKYDDDDDMKACCFPWCRK